MSEKYAFEDILEALNSNQTVNELVRGKFYKAFESIVGSLSEEEENLLCKNEKFQGFISGCIYRDSFYSSVYAFPGDVYGWLKRYKEKIGMILGDKSWFI